MSSDSPDNWIDAELRHVPLPPGLVERLRAASQLTDDDIDTWLGEVAVPVGLVAQLREIVADEALDLRLCAVDTPVGLLDELQAIPTDEALRDVPVPEELLVELRRIPPRPWRWSPAQIALAASLMLLVTGAYVSSVVGWMMSAYNSANGITATVLMLPEPGVELTSAVSAPVSLAIDDEAPRPSSTAIVIADDDPLDRPIDTRTIQQQLDTVLPVGYDLTDHVLPLRYGILGQNSASEERGPDLETVQLAEPRGVEPPIVAGFDRKFLVKHRTQPVVVLAAAPTLAQQRLPLWRETTSFDRLRTAAAHGQLPAAHEIQVEDFLAAMECQFAPAAPGELGIRTAAGPSPLSKGEASLLQVGVQAGALVRKSPVHLTVVVDTSDSMRWSDRLERVRHVLRRLVAQMGESDRMSLVVFNDAADTIVEDAGRSDAATIDEAIDALSAHGSSNFGAGLQQAAMASESPAALALGNRRIILLTDSLPALPADVSTQVDALVEELLTARIAIDVVDVDSDADARLKSFALRCRQSLIVARDADALQRQLVQRITGASPEIAAGATIRLRFNPQSVKAYRLLGHEAIALGGMPASIESSLLAGESAMVLLEVWLHDSGPSDVATVELQWNDTDGRRRARHEEVRRVQFVPSLREAALSLQAAAIAAEAAEALRQSPFTLARDRDLRPVLQAAEEVNPRLAERPAFRRFVAVLREAERARRGAK